MGLSDRMGGTGRQPDKVRRSGATRLPAPMCPASSQRTAEHAGQRHTASLVPIEYLPFALFALLSASPMTVIALYNLKGGVGKTAAAVNLAYLSAEEGLPTLVWDLDPQAAATFYFRIKPKVRGTTRDLVRGQVNLDKQIRGSDFEQLDLLPADLSYRKMDVALDRAGKADRRLRRLLKPFKSDYSNVFLDCPPSLTQVSVSIFNAADVLLIPVIPTVLSMRTLGQVLGFLDREEIPRPITLPFFSMADFRKKMHKELCHEYLESGQHGFLRTIIPFSSEIEKMGVRRAPLPSYSPSSPASEAYRSLWEEVKERLGPVDPGRDFE